MRWLARLGFALLILLLTLSLGLWALIKHPTISAWAVTQLVQQFPMVTVARISGNIWGGLAFSQLMVKQDDVVLIIEDGFVRWRWQDLWQSESVHIADGSLGRVAIDLPYVKPSSETADFDWRSLELPDVMLPIVVQLGQLRVHQLSLFLANSQLIELSDVATSLDIQSNQLNIKHFSASMQTPMPVLTSLSGKVGLVSPHAYQLGIESDAMLDDWAEAKSSLMITGDAQTLVAHLETQADVTPLGSVLAQGDIWLTREQVCSPELTLVTPLGQISLTDVQAHWSAEPQLTAIARVDAYQNTLVMRGQFYPQPDISLFIDAVNLSHFKSLLPLAGNIQAQGKLRGDWQAPQGEVNLQAQGLAWKTHQVAQLSLQAKGDTQQLSAQLEAKGLSDAAKDSRVTMRWQGALAKHQLSLSAVAGGASLSSRLVGGLDEQQQWTGRLEQLQLIQADAGLWQQTAAARLSASAAAVSLQSPLCLQQMTTQACVTQASWSQKQGTQVSAKLDEVWLSRFQPWLPKTLKLPGKAQAHAQFRQQGSTRQGRLTLSLPASQLNYATLSGVQSLAYDGINLTAELNNEQMSTELNARFRQGVSLEARSRHTWGAWDNLDVQGQLRVESLSIAQGILPDITGLAGRLTSHFSLAGRLNQPQLSAQLALASVKLTPIVTGVEFRLPQLFLDIKPTGSVSIDGQLLAGEGQASLKGWGSVADWSKWNMDLTLQGQNLLIAKTPQADIWLSPNIQLSAVPEQVDILGQLIVPKARLRAQSVGSKGVGLSDDVVIVGEENNSAKMKLVPHMRVLLGDDISLSGSGLSAGLTGQLEITRSRLGNLLFQGEVNTKNGQFKAYQQDLTIEQGRILFNGVSDNPGLNVVASRKVLDETVGVTVTGSLAKPRLKVFSRPTMPDTDALSLLVLGKKTRDMTATDAAVLATKLATESDDDPLLQRLGQEAGLDLGLTNIKGEKNTGLSLGKRLTPDLYVRYVVGAFEYGARFITEYRINRLFSVEVQTGQYSGGDIFYRFEGD